MFNSSFLKGDPLDPNCFSAEGSYVALDAFRLLAFSQSTRSLVYFHDRIHTPA